MAAILRYLLVSLVFVGTVFTTPTLPGSFHDPDTTTAALVPRTRVELYADFQSLVANSNGALTAERIGESYRSRRTLPASDNGIWAFRAGRTSDPSAPVIVLVGGQHAREVGPPEVLLLVAGRLLAESNSDPLAAALLDRVVIWFVPIMNPDGYDRVVNGRTDWRKNDNPENNNASDDLAGLPQGPGVDLNRNFPTGWGLKAPPDGSGTDWRGASATPVDYDYQGPVAGSEVETQAMMSFIKRVRPNVFITYHSPLATVIWPWGHRLAATAQDRDLASAGRRLGAIHGYPAGQTSQMVGFSTGDIADWTFEQIGGLSFGVEYDGGFVPNDQAVERHADRTYKALRYLAGSLAATAAWTAPRVTALTSSAQPITNGIRATITATVEVSLAGTGAQISAMEVVAGEWITATTVSMRAADGAFDSAIETGVVSLDLPEGLSNVWVRGRATDGTAGPPEAVAIAILPRRSYVPALLR